MANYDSNNTLLNSENYNSPMMENVIPDSINESVYAHACISAMMKELSELSDDPTPSEVKSIANRYPDAFRQFKEYNERNEAEESY